MKIEIEISRERIADMMCGAVEHNSMTRAWCSGVICKTAPKANLGPNWYAEPDMYREGFVIEVVEVLDESKPIGKDNEKRHRVDAGQMARGLAFMAERHGTHFGDMMRENDDNVTHDVFLQCIAMREVKYG